MYTKDNKRSKNKRNKDKNLSKNNENSNNLEGNFYKDFSNNDNDIYNISYEQKYNHSEKVKGKGDKLENLYSNNDADFKGKKYTILIIVLLILLVILLFILVKSINVKNSSIDANSNYVRLQHTQLEMKKGEKKKMELILSDMKGNYKIEWFSSNENVAIVDDNGNIYAINEGEAIILVAYYLGNNVYDAQCHINVSK